MALYRRLSEEAQASAPHGEYNLIRSHNMRRFLNSTLLAEKASIFFVDFLLGHQLDATHEAYYRADPKSLREEYINIRALSYNSKGSRYKRKPGIPEDKAGKPNITD
jgi:integrase